MNDEIFKLYPLNPDTDSKFTIVTDTPQQRDSLTLAVESWRRLLPNKLSVPIENREGIVYQCSGLDANCSIEVKISYRYQGRNMSKVLVSTPVQISPDLRERLLYEPEPIKVRAFMDNFEVFMSVEVKGKKICFKAEMGKFQLPFNESTIEIDPNPAIIRINLQNTKTDFLFFFSNILKIAAKFRSNFCVLVFASKQDRDTFTVQISDSFRQGKPVSNNQIKIVGTSTPRHQNTLKNDHSASSLTSMNRSKNKDKKKVKISERLNLKKSYTKLNSGKLDNNSRQCLNVFDEDDFNDQNNTTKGQETFLNDQSMDLRGSFEELENEKNAPKKEDDILSNGSFRQQKKGNLNPIDQENKRLREENMRLKQQLENNNQIHRDYATLKKKYAAVVEQNNRLESERKAIITDKVRFESSFHRQMQQKQALKKELEMLRSMLGPQGYRRS